MSKLCWKIVIWQSLQIAYTVLDGDNQWLMAFTSAHRLGQSPLLHLQQSCYKGSLCRHTVLNPDSKRHPHYIKRRVALRRNTVKNWSVARLFLPEENCPTFSRGQKSTRHPAHRAWCRRGSEEDPSPVPHSDPRGRGCRSRSRPRPRVTPRGDAPAGRVRAAAALRRAGRDSGRGRALPASCARGAGGAGVAPPPSARNRDCRSPVLPQEKETSSFPVLELFHAQQSKSACKRHILLNLS